MGYHKVMDFSTVNKRLSYIYAWYDGETGLNLIRKIGFGNARLIIEGEFHHGKRFIFPQVLNYRKVREFTFGQLLNLELKFNWFKKYFICRHQSWLCQIF